MLIGQEDTQVYPRLKSVVVYPSAFISEQRTVNLDGTISEGPQVRLGESWGLGTLVLAWDAVQNGAYGVGDGQNVVFHPAFRYARDAQERAASSKERRQRR